MYGRNRPGEPGFLFLCLLALGYPAESPQQGGLASEARVCHLPWRNSLPVAGSAFYVAPASHAAPTLSARRCLWRAQLGDPSIGAGALRPLAFGCLLPSLGTEAAVVCVCAEDCKRPSTPRNIQGPCGRRCLAPRLCKHAAFGAVCLPAAECSPAHLRTVKAGQELVAQARPAACCAGLAAAHRVAADQARRRAAAGKGLPRRAAPRAPWSRRAPVYA